MIIYLRQYYVKSRQEDIFFHWMSLKQDAVVSDYSDVWTHPFDEYE